MLISGITIIDFQFYYYLKGNISPKHGSDIIQGGNFMKNYILAAIVLAVVSIVLLIILVSDPTDPTDVDVTHDYEDGTYRGIYEDQGNQQISIQFDLENGLFTDMSYRKLFYRDNDYLDAEPGDTFYPIRSQHEQALEHLTGRSPDDIDDLYRPGDILNDYEGFSGATVRGTKIRSAIQDGLNRRIYSPANDDFSREIGEYDDGTYRGFFSDAGDQQLNIEFDLINNNFQNLNYRHLYYAGNYYLQAEEGDSIYPIKLQHEQVLDHLESSELSTIFDLHDPGPGEFVEDIDGFTGATLRASKIFSSMIDALNRGLYQPADEDYDREIDDYPTGRYRGVYGERGQQQVSIQFYVMDGEFTDLTYRHLEYGDTYYHELEEGDEQYPVAVQYEYVLAYLDGKPLDALFDLYYPEEFIDDIDVYTGATLRANKVLSAIKDGFNRGIY